MFHGGGDIIISIRSASGDKCTANLALKRAKVHIRVKKAHDGPLLLMTDNVSVFVQLSGGSWGGLQLYWENTLCTLDCKIKGGREEREMAAALQVYCKFSVGERAPELVLQGLCTPSSLIDETQVYLLHSDPQR